MLNLQNFMGDTWDDDVINSSRLDVAEHFDGDPFLIAKAMEAEKNDALSNQPELNKRDSKQIEKILQQTKDKLTSQEGLMFDGNPASPEAIESILSAMEIGMEMAKKKEQEKNIHLKNTKRTDVNGHKKDCKFACQKTQNKKSL